MGREALKLTNIIKHRIKTNPFDTTPKAYIVPFRGSLEGDATILRAKSKEMSELYAKAYEELAKLVDKTPFNFIMYPAVLVYCNGINQPIKLAMDVIIDIDSYADFAKLYTHYLHSDVATQFILDESSIDHQLYLSLVGSAWHLDDFIYLLKTIDRKILA
jgi:hypothetical protein